MSAHGKNPLIGCVRAFYLSQERFCCDSLAWLGLAGKIFRLRFGACCRLKSLLSRAWILPHLCHVLERCCSAICKVFQDWAGDMPSIKYCIFLRKPSWPASCPKMNETLIRRRFERCLIRSFTTAHRFRDICFYSSILPPQWCCCRFSTYHCPNGETFGTN